MSTSIRSLIAVCLVTFVVSLPSRLPADDATVRRVVGVAGCTAASCHGGKSLIGGEATAWLTRDAAHRRAYDVLFNETSVRMVKQLGLKAAHTEARCLACHSTESAAPHGAKGERFSFEFGVGCESCHGAAGDWVARHTDRTWRSLPAETKAALGFRDLRSLTTRAESCVACHVGSSQAIVDHDLIAAGHPRLTFEMSAYHAMLPKHWDSATEQQRDHAQELRLWAIGHGVSAAAISNIATARAESAIKSGTKHVTPDLSEFDCHACHHDLAEPTGDRPTHRESLGSPRWGSWSIHPAQVATRHSQATFGQDGSAAEASLTKLLNLIDKSRLGTTPADTLLQTAQPSSRDLLTWSRSLELVTITPAQTQQFLRTLIATESDRDWLPTWDGQAQRYLSLVAVNQSLRDRSGQTILATNTIAKFPMQLRFPAGYATPRGFSSKPLDELFEQLRKATPPSR